MTQLRDITSTAIEPAVEALHSGGVIAYPTEAVFGLGCDPNNEPALQRIIEIKGRDAHKGFIVIASSQHQLEAFMAPVSADQQAQLEAHWPGPVTFVVPASTDYARSLLSGYRDTLAVRVSNHPLVIELCEQFDGAIVSTSANRSGQPALRSATQVVKAMGDDLDSVVDAKTGQLESPTRIVELVSGVQLR